ncbi:MAG: DUF5693 family protein [Filifactoraceae bacterium]
MRIDKVCALFLALGIIFSAIATVQRVNIEKSYTNYQIVMDYQELIKLAATASEDLTSYAQKMSEAGVSSVAITEESIDTISQNPNYHVRYYLSGYDLMVEGEKEALDFIKKGFEETLKEERTINFENNNLLRIQGNVKDFMYNNTKVKDYLGNNKQAMNIFVGSKLVSIGIGFDGEKIKTMQDAGIKVNLRPIYYSSLQDGKKSVDRFFDTLDAYGIDQNFIISSGGEVLGYDEAGYLVEVMNKRNMCLVPIEDTTQRQHIKAEGQDEIIEKMDYNAVRGFTTWDYIQRRFDYKMPLHHNGEEIVNTFYRAIAERNIRVVYFKPYVTAKETYVTDISVYKKTLTSLEKRLEKHGIVLGEVKAMKKWDFSPMMKLPIIVGIIAAGFMLLDNIFRIRKKQLEIGFVLSALGCVGIYLTGASRDLLDKMFALMGAIFLPCLAICFVIAVIKGIYEHERRRKPSEAFVLGGLTLLSAILISLVGAMFEISMLSHSKYLLEIDIFKGVKLSQLAPIGVAILLYLSYFGYKREKSNKDIGLSIREFIGGLNQNIKIWQVMLVGLLLVVVYIFIGRSGNDSGLSVSSPELLFRNILELVFPARPRTKSIFMGFPAVVFVVYLTYINRYRWLTPLLVLFVAIGQSNITNTFSHLRTPLVMSIQRVSVEYLLGIGISVVFILCLNIIIRGERVFRARVKVK